MLDRCQENHGAIPGIHDLINRAYMRDGQGNSMTYGYDANNQFATIVRLGTTAFEYDEQNPGTHTLIPGAVTTTYGYDYENRLASVSNPSYTAAYTYAADGLRLRAQESNAQYTDRWLQPLGPFGAGVAAQRVQPYDGVRPVLEGTLSGDVYTTTAKYVWEGNGYYDPLMYSLISGAWRYHMYDGLGSTRQLMLHASPYTVTDTYSYEAFGNLLASTGTTPNLARSPSAGWWAGPPWRCGRAAPSHVSLRRLSGLLSDRKLPHAPRRALLYAGGGALCQHRSPARPSCRVQGRACHACVANPVRICE